MHPKYIYMHVEPVYMPVTSAPHGSQNACQSVCDAQCTCMSFKFTCIPTIQVNWHLLRITSFCLQLFLFRMHLIFLDWDSGSSQYPFECIYFRSACISWFWICMPIRFQCTEHVFSIYALPNYTNELTPDASIKGSFSSLVTTPSEYKKNTTHFCKCTFALYYSTVHCTIFFSGWVHSPIS